MSSPKDVEHMKAAVAEPDPALEPPVNRSRFQGIPVVPEALGDADGELRHVGLAQHDGPGLFQVGDGRCVLVGDEVGHYARTGGGTDSLGPELVFDRNRDTVHWAEIVA